MNNGCAEPGCYEDQITYSHDITQIESIISWSTEAGFQTDILNHSKYSSSYYKAHKFENHQSANNQFC